MIMTTVYDVIGSDIRDVIEHIQLDERFEEKSRPVGGTAYFDVEVLVSCRVEYEFDDEVDVPALLLCEEDKGNISIVPSGASVSDIVEKIAEIARDRFHASASYFDITNSNVDILDADIRDVDLDYIEYDSDTDALIKALKANSKAAAKIEEPVERQVPSELKEVVEFVRAHSFQYNLILDVLIGTEPPTKLFEAFVFFDSPEGHDFWSEVGSGVLSQEHRLALLRYAEAYNRYVA
jgi:hypothetical protein